MNHIFFYSLLFLFYFESSSQNAVDSLYDFDIASQVMRAHKNGCYDKETRVFIEYAKRNFLKAKYNLISVPLVTNPAGKYNPSAVASFACVDEDFEALSVGTMSSTSWSAGLGTIAGAGSCGTVAATYTSNPANAIVVVTPYTDLLCNNVPHSPFGGTKVLQLNKTNNAAIPSRVIQTFAVTAANFQYQYAYKGVLNTRGSHSCCEQPALFF